VLATPVWAVGYGKNIPVEWDSEHCVGCNTRRAGEVSNIYWGNDPCGLLEADCWEDALWYGPTIQEEDDDDEGNSVEIAKGDSGGGLFFNALGSRPLVAGVAALHSDNNPTAQRWASTTKSADFLWAALGWGYTLDLSTLQQTAAIYARSAAKINDRARVAYDESGTMGAPILVVGIYVQADDGAGGFDSEPTGVR
jgi:hypothetical protein